MSREGRTPGETLTSHCLRVPEKISQPAICHTYVSGGQDARRDTDLQLPQGSRKNLPTCNLPSLCLGSTWTCGETLTSNCPRVSKKTRIPPEQDFCNLKPEFVGWSELAKSNKVAPAHLRCWGSLRSPQPTIRDLDKDVRMRRTGMLMLREDKSSSALCQAIPRLLMYHSRQYSLSIVAKVYKT